MCVSVCVCETDVSLNDVAVVVTNVSSQTEVTDLCNAMICQQHVPGSHISVDALRTGERQVKDRSETGETG